MRLNLNLASLALLALSVSVMSEAQVSPPAPAPLSIEEIVKLQQAGFSEDVIITKIRKSGKAFDLSTEELLELHKIGISDHIIRFLLDPSQPYTPSAGAPPVPSDPAIKPAVPAKQYPDDADASKVPPEPGLYLLQNSDPAKIEARILLGSDEKGGIGSFLKKGKIVAYLVGAASKNRTQENSPTFYLRLAEGRALEEIVLMTLTRKGARRELEIGPAGKKQEFKTELMRSFDSLEVGARLYKLTTAKLGPGEYLFFQIGSAEPAKGSYGKGFDFGVDEPKTAPAKP